MSARFIIHTIYLTLATTLTYFWTQSPQLSPYTLQLVAVLVLTYFATNLLTKKSHKTQPTITIDLIILTTVILLLVSETGGLASPLFFTAYFLLFGVALLFEVEATLTLTAILIIFFSFLPSTNITNITHLAELIALVMITPLAIYTAHEHEELVKEQIKNKEALYHTKTQETDTLLFLSLELRKTLSSTLDKLSLLIPKISLHYAREDLKKIYSDLKALYQSAQQLKDKVDTETD